MKIGTQILSLFLALLIIWSSLRISFTYAYYSIDPEGFVELLCINQDKPEMKCNGKCELSKVSKSQSEDNNIPTSIIDISELRFYLVNSNSLEESRVLFDAELHLFLYSNLYNYESTKNCFHPPKC